VAGIGINATVLFSDAQVLEAMTTEADRLRST
jgi:hypothetical protein